MPINGRSKGKRAELEVAKLCEAWWRALEPECRFVRTPASGGWHGPDVRAEFKTSGDLMSTAKLWPFSVEVKKREGWSLEWLSFGRPSPVWAWWEQCRKAAREDGREPLLLFTRNRAPWLAMARRRFHEELRPYAPPTPWSIPRRGMIAMGIEPVDVFGLDALLAISPTLIIGAATRVAAR